MNCLEVFKTVIWGEIFSNVQLYSIHVNGPKYILEETQLYIFGENTATKTVFWGRVLQHVIIFTPIFI